MKLRFTKSHGLGNDFIVVDLRRKNIKNLPRIVKKLSDRRFGVGFDQALILKESKKADFRMDVYNADGSRAEMCGNGIRCLAAYIWKRRLSTKNPLAIETLAGVIKPKREKGGLVTVDMGRPIFEGSSIPTVEKGEIKDRPFKIADREFRITCVSMGNPHCVIFVKDAEGFPVEKYGPLIESHLFFPEKTNVEFVQVINRRRLRMRVWERGAGETPACGTGACAAAVVSRRMGFTAAGVSVILKGGVLYIEWRNDGRVYMKGPAKEVFTAEATI